LAGEPGRRMVRTARGVSGAVRHLPPAAARGAGARGGEPRGSQQQDASEAMSRAVVVRYRVKPDAVEANEELVRAVFAELEEKRPDGLRYRTVRVDDHTFVHVAVLDGDANPLDEIAAFAAFTAAIGERCEELPQASVGELVGSYP